jgi:hypothetical protein
MKDKKKGTQVLKEDQTYKFVVALSILITISIAASIFVFKYKNQNELNLLGYFNTPQKQTDLQNKLETVNYKNSMPNAKPSKSKRVINNPEKQKCKTNKSVRRISRNSGTQYDTIYSWVDDKGVKHFGNSKPVDTEDYNVRRMAKSKYRPKPKPRNHYIPTRTTFTKSQYNTKNHKNTYEPEERYGVTRQQLMDKIESNKEDLERYKDRLRREKKELFDIRRTPHTVRSSGRKRDRVERQESTIEYWEDRIQEAREEIDECELAVAYGRYD